MVAQIEEITPRKLFINKSNELNFVVFCNNKRVINDMLQAVGVCDRDRSGTESLKWFSTLGIQQYVSQEFVSQLHLSNTDNYSNKSYTNISILYYLFDTKLN